MRTRSCGGGRRAAGHGRRRQHPRPRDRAPASASASAQPVGGGGRLGRDRCAMAMRDAHREISDSMALPTFGRTRARASTTSSVRRPCSHRHDVAALAQHGVAECLVLDPQRLALGEREPGDVALGDPAERRDGLPLEWRSCRWRRTSGRRSTVSATKAPRSPVTTVTRSFIGLQPVDEVVDDDAVRQPPGDRDHVLVLAAALVRRLRRDRRRSRSGRPRRSGRCRAWPRSLTTPTSAMRAGNGPWRRVAIW